MTYVLAGLAGAAGLALGWFAFAAIGSVVAGWLGVSNMEGARGMVAAWLFGPIGALGGLVAGLVLVLRYHGGYTGFGDIAWRGAAVVAGIGALAAVGVFARMQASTLHGGNRGTPTLEFELALPEADLPADPHALKAEIHTSEATGDVLFSLDKIRAEGGRRVVPGVAWLHHRVSSRLFVVKLPGRDIVFDLRLARSPASTKEYGAWRPADHVFEAGQGQARKSKPEENFALRQRVRWPGDD